MTTLSRRVSRASWTDRAWKSHYVQQAIRFVRLFIIAFVTQLFIWSQHGVDQHMDWKVLGSLVFAAAEFVWREVFPTTPPAPADPPAPQDDTTVTPTDPVVQDDVTVIPPDASSDEPKALHKKTTPRKRNGPGRR